MGPSLSLSESHGLVGSTVTATGTGYAANSAFTLLWDFAPSTSCHGPSVTSASGSLSCTFVVPNSASGVNTVGVRDRSENGNFVTESYTVGPSLTLSSSSGMSGTPLTVTGTGFGEYAAVTITLAPQPATVCTTTSIQGAFTCTFSLPTLPNGAYTVTAKDNAHPRDTARASFQLISAIGSAGTGVSGATPAGPHPMSNPLSAGAVTPASPTMDYGQSITLTSNPGGGTPPYSYQWYWSSSNSGLCSAGTALGAGSTQVTGLEVTGPGTYYYCYVVTDSVPNSASSGWDALTVDSALSAGTLSPSPVTMDIGQTIDLTANPSGGTGHYGFQWQVGSSSTCSSNSAISGATNPTYAATPSSSVYYCVVITDTGVSSGTSPSEIVYSPSDLVTVDTAPSVTVAPTPATIDMGQSIALTATPAGGTASSWGYQWYRELVDVRERHHRGPDHSGGHDNAGLARDHVPIA